MQGTAILTAVFCFTLFSISVSLCLLNSIAVQHWTEKRRLCSWGVLFLENQIQFYCHGLRPFNYTFISTELESYDGRFTFSFFLFFYLPCCCHTFKKMKGSVLFEKYFILLSWPQISFEPNILDEKFYWVSNTLTVCYCVARVVLKVYFCFTLNTKPYQNYSSKYGNLNFIIPENTSTEPKLS